MIGKYERDEAPPFIDAAKKIADALVSLDNLGEGAFKTFDKKTHKVCQRYFNLTRHHCDKQVQHPIANKTFFSAWSNKGSWEKPRNSSKI